MSTFAAGVISVLCTPLVVVLLSRKTPSAWLPFLLASVVAFDVAIGATGPHKCSDVPLIHARDKDNWRALCRLYGRRLARNYFGIRSQWREAALGVALSTDTWPWMRWFELCCVRYNMEQQAMQIPVSPGNQGADARKIADPSVAVDEVFRAVGDPVQYLTHDPLKSMARIFGVYDAMNSIAWDESWKLTQDLFITSPYTRANMTEEQVNAWLAAWIAWHASNNPNA